MKRMNRSRWAAIGAAVAVTLGAGAVHFVGATTAPTPSVLLPWVPCRLIDTRVPTGSEPSARRGGDGERSGGRVVVRRQVQHPTAEPT